MTAVMEQVFQRLSDSANAVLQVQSLEELVESDLPFQSFIERLLPQLCALYNGLAAVAWLKSQGAVFGIRYRMDTLLTSMAQHKIHEQLIQFAWHHHQAMLAEPAQSSLPGNSANDANNPTPYHLLFAPVMNLGEPIVLLEIVLPSNALTTIEDSQQSRQLYLHSAHLIAQRIYAGLKKRMTMPPAELRQATTELQKLSVELHNHQLQIQRAIEARLSNFRGWSFGSLSQNQEFARLIHQLLDSYGLRVVCPECGYPAILRCLRAGNAKHGVFVFDHYLDAGRTFHGGPTTVPLLKVAPKPARRSVQQQDG